MVKCLGCSSFLIERKDNRSPAPARVRAPRMRQVNKRGICAIEPIHGASLSLTLAVTLHFSFDRNDITSLFLHRWYWIDGQVYPCRHLGRAATEREQVRTSNGSFGGSSHR